jgi:hypothetical protein
MSAETKTLKCGLIMPISAIDGCSEGHWDDVRSIIKEALVDTQFSVELVSDSNEIGIIQKRIVQNIYDNDIVVCDVSAKNPNVMFELGMRLAFDKPAIIIKDDKTNYSFDTSPIEHLQYPRDLHYHTIQNFKIKLREKVLATYSASKREDYTTFLKHFGQFVVAKIDEKPVGKDEYLLQAISELRDEVESLAKTQRAKTATTRSSRFIHEIPSYWDISAPDEEAMLIIKAGSFTKNYLEKIESSSKIEELRDSSSPAFREMLREFLRSHIGTSIVTEKTMQFISSALSQAVASLSKSM